MTAYCRTNITSIKGQALVENVLLIPLIVMIILMISFFSRLVLTRQQLLVAARHGTDLIAYTDMNEEQIKAEIVDFLSGKDEKGRKLDPKKLTIRIKIDRFPKITFSNLLDVLEHFYKPTEHTSNVEIRYTFYAPRIFSVVGRDTIAVSARSEVLAGTGA